MFVLAGKNVLAAQGLDMLLELVPGNEITVIPSKRVVDIPFDGDHLIERAKKNGVAIGSLRDLRPENIRFFLSLEFDQLLPLEWTTNANCFNVHFSLLPAYKGMFTSTLPILNGEAYTGVSLHEIDGGIDTGALVDQERISIDRKTTARGLYETYCEVGLDLLRRNLPYLLSGKYMAIPQKAEGSSYFSKSAVDFSKTEIQFGQTAEQIRRFVAALYFPEYQTATFQGRPLCQALPTPARSVKKPGQLQSESAGSATVATIDFDVQLNFFQKNPNL